MQLIEVLDHFGIVHRSSSDDHHVSANWVGLNCPWCGSSSFHLGINLRDYRCSCWRCGNRSAIAAVAMLGAVSIGQVRAVWPATPNTTIREPAVGGKLIRPKGIGDLLPRQISYLEGRGFNVDEVSSLWKIRGIEFGYPLQWRIYIPIFDQYGREVSWTTRSISPSAELRYLSASAEEEAVPHKSILYGAHLARHCIVIVEGPLDAWAIGPGAVATCGTGFSSSQVVEMSKYPVRVVCFDASAAAQQRARQLCNRLSLYRGSTENVLLEDCDDAADALIKAPKELESLRNQYNIASFAA